MAPAKKLFGGAAAGQIATKAKISGGVVMGKKMDPAALAVIGQAIGRGIDEGHITPVNILASQAKVTLVAPGGGAQPKDGVKYDKNYQPKDMFGVGEEPAKPALK
jgi:hypothetical protein